MRFKLILYLSILLLISTASVYATDMAILYYVLSNSDGNTLYRIVDNSQPEAVVELPGAYSFSFDGNRIVYFDSDGVWLTRLDDWNPVQIISDDGYKSNWLWTPDDVRFIVRVTSGITIERNEIDPRTYAYNTETGQMENWDWGDCKHIGRNLESRKIAMICFANDWIENPEIPAIALYWGGEYIPYEPSDFEILLENYYGYRPILPFEWTLFESGEHFVYRAPNPDFSLTTLEEDEPVQDIFWLFDDDNVNSLNLSEDYGLTQWLAVSPNRTTVAFDINCNFMELRYCLAIADLQTGEIVQDFQDDFFVRFLFDIAWFPDNRRVAFLGQMDSSGEPTLIVVDTESGHYIEYDLGEALDQVDSISITTHPSN